MIKSIACLFIGALLLGSITVDSLAPTSSETSTTTTIATNQSVTVQNTTTTSPSSVGVTSCYATDLNNPFTAAVENTCAAGSTSCFTFTFSALGQSASFKGCTTNCIPGNGQGPNGLSGSFTCCSTDNCNSSSNLISNKIFTGSSILIAVILAMLNL